MMKNNKDYIQISIGGTFEGKEIGLDNIPIGDLQNLLEITNLTLYGVSSDNNDKAFITSKTPIAIKKGSVALVVGTNSPSIIQGIHKDIDTIIKTNDLAEASNSSMKKVANRIIEKYGKNKDIKVKISSSYEGQENSIVIDSDTTLTDSSKPIFIESEDYIYGSIYDAGGINPNIHLNTGSERIKISISKEDLAKVEGNILYKPKGVHVCFKEDIRTGYREDYRFKGFIDYNPKMTIKELRDFVNHQIKGWSKIDNIEEKIKEMRG